MRIVFVCTGNSFTPTMLYKENYFIRAAVNKGYKVLVVASEYMYIDGVRKRIGPYEGEIDGYKLVRIPYKKYLGSNYFSEKIRNAPGMTERIIDFAPDYIFYNCPQIYNIKEVVKIKKALPGCKVALDFSTKYINSARNALSLNILHKGIYKRWLKKAVPYIDKIYYVSQETLQFIREVYDLPEELMIENGLPGEVCAYGKREYFREKIVSEFDFPTDSIIMLHSGKIGILKRTVELLRFFHTNEDKRFRLIIAGSIEDTVKDDITDIIGKDDSIKYIGFVTGERLTELLCGTDLYLQPGTISQTSQTAICCGCPIMFMDCPTNRALFAENGFLLQNLDEIKDVFERVSQEPDILKRMSEKSYELAFEELEYEKLLMKAMLSAGVNI